MSTRFCAKCGAEATDAKFRFCARCGAALATAAADVEADAGATVVKPLARRAEPEAAPPTYAVPPPAPLPPPVGAPFPPGYAREQTSAAPRLIAALVLLVYVGVEIWGLADRGSAYAPIPREGWSAFGDLPGEIQLAFAGGIALLVSAVLALLVSPAGRVACGFLLLVSSGAYLASLLIYFGRMHELGAWIRDGGTTSGTFLAVGVIGVIGAIAYLATSVRRS